MSPLSPPLKVGFVPEHFSTPLHFCATPQTPDGPTLFQTSNLTVELVPFPSGTGHMVTSLRTHEIDVAIGLTEGFIAALGRGASDPFRLVGSYVDTPLCWAISTGRERGDVPGTAGLKGGKLGVSRIGSGSYVMGYVLAEREGWLDDAVEAEEKKKKEPFEFVVLDNFRRLRDGVNDGTADAFMWEYFTSKKFYDSNEIRQLGEIYTPWPSWHIVAHTSLLPHLYHPTPTSSSTTTISPDPRLPLFLDCLNKGIAHFNAHPEDAVQYISTTKTMEYSEEDARAWLTTVKFTEDTRVVRREVVERCVGILRKAGVVSGEGGLPVEEMVVRVD